MHLRISDLVKVVVLNITLLVIPLQSQEQVNFGNEIYPILKTNCFACHGKDQQMGEFRLDNRTSALKGGISGPSILPGHAETSSLVQRISHVEGVNPMPMGNAKLSPKEITLIKLWVEQGAIWPANVGELEGKVKRHWAYVTPNQSASSSVDDDWGRNPLDSFVAAKLREKSLSPNPEASRETLIRRLSLDLTGLPPTENQVEHFLEDNSPEAYMKLVERLLASQRYGEHWASSWLDLARYADTNGYESDEPRTMWLYRDWVVNAFNCNMRFDEFTIAQLAGDLLPEATERQKIATGFHRNTLINNEAGSKNDEFYDAAVKDRVDTTGTVWLGSTVGCAQCHDHKYDPFTQEDYYRLYAVFNNTTDSAIELSNEMDVFHGSKKELKLREAGLAQLDKILGTSTPQLQLTQQKWENQFVLLNGESNKKWLPVRILNAQSSDDTQLVVDDDGAIIIEDKNTLSKVLDIDIETTHANTTAFRIESASAKGLNPNPLSENITETEQQKTPIPMAIRGIEILDYSESKLQDRIEAASDNLKFDDWHMIGPFRELSRQTAFKKQHGPETDYDLSKLYENGNLFWRKRADWSDGLSHLLQGEHAAIYVHRTVTTKDPMQLRISLGSDKSIELWFNKKKVFSKDLTREVRSDQEIITLNLNKGENHIVLKLANDTGSYSFYFRAYTEPEWKARIKTTAAAADVGTDDVLALTNLINGQNNRPWELSQREGGGIAIFQMTQAIVGNKLKVRVLFDRQWSPSTPARRMPARLHITSTNLSKPVIDELLRTPVSIRNVVTKKASTRNLNENERLAKHYRSIAPYLDDTREKRAQVSQSLEKFRATNTTQTLVMKERENPRETFVQNRGSFLDLTDRVRPGVPRVFDEALKIKDRLGLAQWLVSKSNPLTSRVRVNQVWASLFGQGIVKSLEDFGSQSDPPSHPKLLDWLATEFVRTGWNQKKLLKTIVSSATYRQSSVVSPQKLERDPANEWLSRGARFRVRSEAIRDLALQISGSLSTKMGGPSVFPPQPESVLNDRFIEGGFRLWNTSKGEDRYRRALYTFFKRTTVYPMMTTFDAPDRTVCTVDRPRSNTPLQALNTLNDPVFLEAAGAFARLITLQHTTPVGRIDYAFRRALARRPSPREASSMLEYYMKWSQHYRSQESAAERLINQALNEPLNDTPATSLAPWIVVANVILNLDETMTRE